MLQQMSQLVNMIFNVRPVNVTICCKTSLPNVTFIVGTAWQILCMQNPQYQRMHCETDASRSKTVPVKCNRASLAEITISSESHLANQVRSKVPATAMVRQFTDKRKYFSYFSRVLFFAWWHAFAGFTLASSGQGLKVVTWPWRPRHLARWSLWKLVIKQRKILWKVTKIYTSQHDRVQQQFSCCEFTDTFTDAVNLCLSWQQQNVHIHCDTIARRG